jgi:hypothetical protein
MIIHYCTLSKNLKIGSVNERKIKTLAQAFGKPFFQCDIAEFDGRLINPEWLGKYPEIQPKLLNFKLPLLVTKL